MGKNEIWGCNLEFNLVTKPIKLRYKIENCDFLLKNIQNFDIKYFANFSKKLAKLVKYTLQKQTIQTFFEFFSWRKLGKKLWKKKNTN